MRRARVAAGLMLGAAVVAAGGPARADGERVFEWLPGSARAIPRTTSASRDTPVLEYAYGPRAQASIGAEVGLVALHFPWDSLRFGFYGMVALENRDLTAAWPSVELWRGLLGVSVSLSPEYLARRFLGPGSTLELSVVVGHESDHRTDDHTVDPPAPGDIPSGGGGDFVAPDLAVSLPAGRFGRVTVRLLDRAYVRGAFRQVPGADLAFRLRPLPWLQPTVALYGEGQLPRDAGVRLGYFARMLAGVAFVGKFGEVTPFYSLDMGTGKGFLINRREVRSSFGVRYAPF